jgi:hypothetical protein
VRRRGARAQDEVAGRRSAAARTRVELLEEDVQELRVRVRELLLLVRVIAVLLGGHVAGSLLDLLTAGAGAADAIARVLP